MADGTTKATTEVLDEATCLDLLASEPVGRLAFTYQGDPAILPVNFVVVDGDVAFRTARGSKLEAAQTSPEKVVAFEVDRYDRDDHSGWSVVVKGTRSGVLDEVQRDRLDNDTNLLPWTDTRARATWVRLTPREITGRRIVVVPAD